MATAACDGERANYDQLLAVTIGINLIVTLEKHLLNMIVNLV